MTTIHSWCWLHTSCYGISFLLYRDGAEFVDDDWSCGRRPSTQNTRNVLAPIRVIGCDNSIFKDCELFAKSDYLILPKKIVCRFIGKQII